MFLRRSEGKSTSPSRTLTESPFGTSRQGLGPRNREGSLAWITLALIGITSARAIFWTIPTRFLTGLAAAGGLAFINSVGTLGGFVGPYAVGWLRDTTGSFSQG